MSVGSRFRQLRANRFVKGVTVLAGGTVLSQLIVLAASPLLTRLYSPAEWGVLAIFVSIIGMFSVITSLRYEIAIAIPPAPETAARLWVLSICITVGLSVFAALLVLVASDYLFSNPALLVVQPYRWLLPLSFLATGLYMSSSYWAVRAKNFKLIARTKLAQGISLTLVQVVSGLAGLGAIGLIAGDMVGRAAGLTSLVRDAWRRDKRVLKAVQPSDLPSVAAEYKKFPLFLGTSGLLNSAAGALPALLLAAYYGPQVAGWFALSERIFKAPMQLVGQAVSQVYLGEGAELAQRDPALLSAMFKKTALTLASLALAIAIPIVLIAPWAFQTVFGDAWRQAGVYSQVLAGMFLLQLVANPLSHTLMMLERQDLQAFWDALRLGIVVGGMVVVRALGGSSYQMVAYYAFAMFISYGVLVSMCLQQLAVKTRQHQRDVEVTAPSEERGGI